MHGCFHALRARRLAALGVAIASVFLTGFDVSETQPSVYRIIVLGQRSSGFGSGFLVQGQRFVVTNDHVVSGSGANPRILIAFKRHGQPVTVPARLVKRLAQTTDRDLALLEAESDLPGKPLTLGVYEPELASSAHLVGFPGASDIGELTADKQGRLLFPPDFLDATVTNGNVSRFFAHPGVFGGGQTVQHTAPSNPGNSGGPLFDACNNVIGVTTLSRNNAAGTFLASHASETLRFLQPQVNPATTSVRCLTGLASSRERLQYIYAVAGLTLLLATAALVVAWRKKPQAVQASYSYVRERVASALQKQAHHAPARRDPAPAAAPAAAQAPARPLRLVPAAGGSTIEIPASRLAGGRTLRVGRGQDADIVVAHDTVSKSHASLSLDDGRYWVEDRGSSNGTFTDGQRITARVPLAPGSRLRLGEVEFRVDA